MVIPRFYGTCNTTKIELLAGCLPVQGDAMAIRSSLRVLGFNCAGVRAPGECCCPCEAFVTPGKQASSVSLMSDASKFQVKCLQLVGFCLTLVLKNEKLDILKQSKASTGDSQVDALIRAAAKEVPLSDTHIVKTVVFR
eukprot:236273-Hanusia_phi.AAC.2